MASFGKYYVINKICCVYFVTHLILPFSSLNLGRTILIDVDSSKIYNVSMAMIKLLTGLGPA